MVTKLYPPASQTMGLLLKAVFKVPILDLVGKMHVSSLQDSLGTQISIEVEAKVKLNNI